MGEYTTFECRECGYTAERIRWGVSVNDPRQRFMPALLRGVQAIVEVDLTGADIHDRRVPLRRVRQRAVLPREGASYTCPKCKAHDMMLHQGEYW